MASRKFKSGDLKPVHLNLIKLDREFQLLASQDAVASDAEDSGEKHQKKNVKNGKKGYHQYEYHHHHHRHHPGKQSHSGKQQRQPQLQHASKPSGDRTLLTNVLHRHSHDSVAVTAAGTRHRASHTHTKNHHVSDLGFGNELPAADLSKMQNKKAPDKLHSSSKAPELTPTGRARAQSAGVLSRTRSPRLNGADLYIARFGGLGERVSNNARKRPPATPKVSTEDENAADELSRCSSRTTSSEKSLHDELIDPYPKQHTQTTREIEETIDPASIHASRPCYRCVMYMHNVGIRRVHWTTDTGEWESAKVRDLVDTLNGSVDGAASGSGCGMFVTKHEVLMMRRLMGTTL